MSYTIRCNGRVLGVTSFDLHPMLHGQHSGWLYPDAAATDLLDAVSIGYASVRAWMTRGTMLPNGSPLTQPEYAMSPECQAITVSVAARQHFALTVHRVDGSDLPTHEVIVQDFHTWPTPWHDQSATHSLNDDEPCEDDTDPYEGLDEAKRAELEAIVEHDIGVWREMHADRLQAAEYSADSVQVDDAAWEAEVDAIARAAQRSRYQVHVRLANSNDLPANLEWLAGGAE